MAEKVNLIDLTVEELEKLLESMGQEKYRSKQIFQWLGKGIREIDEMTNISKTLRESLKDYAYIGRLKILNRNVSKIDSTTKYLFELTDGNIIESVLMEYKHGLSVCISSQVGCKMGCKFCASTGIGFMRNLTAGEMLDQIMSIQQDAGNRVGHVVIMGIGEPLDNYDNVVKFLKLVNHPDSLNIGYRNISLSTSGLVPNIIRLSKEGMPITLSVSLHAPNDEIRDRLMPVNKKYSIDKLIEACKIYTEVTKRRISFEYAMISGINDSDENAAELGSRVKNMLCHVNLIPVNTVEGTDFKRSNRDRIEKFRRIVERYGAETTVRRELGGDIEAACGQLRRSVIEKRDSGC